MGSTGDNLASTALAISLVALAISLLQLLQQYFATAEGYRQCKADVMGAWSALTESHLDLRNLRYETRFVAPNFMLRSPAEFLSDYSETVFKDKSVDCILPVGHTKVPARTKSTYRLSSARTSWLDLLERLERYQDSLFNDMFEHVPLARNDSEKAEEGRKVSLSKDEWFDHLRTNDGLQAMNMPVITKRVVSWDFVPPEIRKPFATVTLYDLLVLGHRLGMDWTSVNPQDGDLTAQDDVGNDITSYRAHGLGIMVSFQHDAGRGRTKNGGESGAETFHWRDLLVPMACADVLAFGVFPGDPDLGFDDVAVSTHDDLLQFVDTLDVSEDDMVERTSRTRLQASIDSKKMHKSGLDQLLPLIAPCMVLPGCQTTKVRQPIVWCRGGMLDVMKGYLVFRDITDAWRKAESTSQSRKDTLQWISDRWHGLTSRCGRPFVVAVFRDQVPAPKLSTETSRAHKECTEELKTRIEKMLYLLDVAIRDHLHHDHVPFKNQQKAESEKRRPMQTMLDLHLFRALALRERAEKVPREKMYTPDIKFANAPVLCQMMKFQMDDMHELCCEVIRSLLADQYSEGLEQKARPAFDTLVSHAEDIWLIWIFRAMVFNRSCDFVVPRRAVGGKPYNLIPSQWLYSQLPVHVA